MQAPDFWQSGKGGIVAELLSPLGWLYGFATQRKLSSTTPWTSPVPVLCVGNLIAGGAGKTPVALDIGDRLKNKGKAVHFLSRGYGGSEKGPLLVDPARHDFRRVGDEPLLLATRGPTWVSRERKAGCMAAAEAGADVIIMDDGFQNPYIHRNFSLIVVDGGYGFGNGKMIPAGPLRETISTGLSRADAAVIIGEDNTGATAAICQNAHTPLRARLVPDPLPAKATDMPLIAFAGIGRPEKFFRTVADMDFPVITTIPFADHHAYRDAEMKQLLKMAKNANARLLTTEKDAQRLPASFLSEISVLSVRLEWSDEAAIEHLLDGIDNA
ncbi:MAG: tetraacyldisaccharide 4'-kinase [Rhodospirillales bacterium]|nr:tetraacyldisaccharide 4'-kinase [Rhodospirillales bacterium]